jgi:hypothetical protein
VAARVAVIDQGVEVGVSDGKDMPAASAIAPVGSAELLVLLVPKRHAAIAAIASGNVDKG